MIDPTVFSETNPAFFRPVFIQQGNASNILNRPPQLVSGLCHQNTTLERNLHTVNTYVSEATNLLEENNQLPSSFNIAAGGYKMEENPDLVCEDKLLKEDSESRRNCEKFNERSFPARQKITQAEAKYVCHICNRAFVRDDKLKRHIRCVHSHERPFVCEICPKAFARKDKLQEHARHHNRDITFTCPVCSDVFVMRSHLNRHLRTVHEMKPTSNATSGTSSSSNCNPMVAAGGNLSGSVLSGSGIVGSDRSKSFAGNGTTYEKIKSNRPRPDSGKRSRKKASSDSPLPLLQTASASPIGKTVTNLSGSPQPSAFTVPSQLLSTGVGGAHLLADSLLTSGECLSAAPVLSFPPQVTGQQAHHQQHGHGGHYGQMAMQMAHHHHQQQQQQGYNASANMQVNYFINQQQQPQQQLQQQQQQQQQNQPSQQSAFSAAMAASLFSPVSYVGWWPQASPGLMLHPAQHSPAYASSMNGATATENSHNSNNSNSNNNNNSHQQQQHHHHPGLVFPDTGSGAAAAPYAQSRQLSVNSTGHFARAVAGDSLQGEHQPPPPHHQLVQAGMVGGTRPRQTTSSTGQFSSSLQESQMAVRPNAQATAAHVFASLPPLAQAVYYQAASLAATQNGGGGGSGGSSAGSDAGPTPLLNSGQVTQ